MNTVKKYFRLWFKLTIYSFMVTLSSRYNAVLFFIGKFLRFLFFAIFLIALFGRTNTIVGYSVQQVLFFFLTFNLIDTITQLFYREVYRFRPMVVSGDFDLVLIKPINPLFRALAGGADPLDLIMLIPYCIAIFYLGSVIDFSGFFSVILYIVLLINALIIATGFHILVLALAVVTTEIDHSIMIYRDLTSMGRIPVDIYGEPLRSFITFVFPVGIMMTYPAKALFGLLTTFNIVSSILIGILFLYISYKIWHKAIGNYTSASS